MTTVTTHTAIPVTTGIQMQGLVKSFRTPQGPVHAVRNVDISIAPGETETVFIPAFFDGYPQMRVSTRIKAIYACPLE